MTWQLDIPGRPVALNAERKGNRWDRAKATDAVRQMAKVLWRSGVNEGRYPKTLPAITVTVQQLSKDRRWLIDLGSALPHAKAALDGIVDTGLLPNDTAEYVRCLSFIPPAIVGSDALRLTIEVAA